MSRRLLPVGFAAAAVAGGLAVGRWAAPPPAADDPLPAVQPTPARKAPSLDDAAQVVGVAVDGRHRAYPLAELLRPNRHVLNDAVGSAPVTVTFCDLDRCVRVFTAARRDGVPLDVTVAGPNPRRARSMLLEVNGRRYEQDTGSPAAGDGSFPYPTLPHTLTTWGEWRAAHPDTDVVVGDEVHPAGK